MFPPCLLDTILNTPQLYTEALCLFLLGLKSGEGVWVLKKANTEPSVETGTLFCLVTLKFLHLLKQIRVGAPLSIHGRSAGG